MQRLRRRNEKIHLSFKRPSVPLLSLMSNEVRQQWQARRGLPCSYTKCTVMVRRVWLLKQVIKMKPKICFVNPPVLLKRPVSEIIRKLTKKGFKTSLLIPKILFKRRHTSLHHCKQVEKSRIYTYSIINPPFVSAEQPLPITPMFCINTWKAIKNNNIIHMWVPYYLTSFFILLTKRVFFPEKKLILTMDTVPGYSFSMGRFWNTMFKIYNKLFGWLLFGTPSIITLYGESMLPFALRAGVPKQKIRVIPTGIDFKKYDNKSKLQSKASISKELNLKPSTRIILFVGLLIPRKGVDKLIRIANNLRRRDVVFLLVSDGPNRKEYENQVKKLRLEKKVLFLGWRTDMHKLYQASDIFLLPSQGEGLPGVVMEAMSYGVPCVASNIPCIPDLLENGITGFLCKRTNVNDFTAKIGKLLRNKNLRERIAKQGIRKIKGFEWSKVLSKYEKLYV